jgi:hypothetical protein
MSTFIFLRNFFLTIQSRSANSVSGCLLVLVLICGLFGCEDKRAESEQLRSEIDSLQKRMDQMYKPGLGEFMSSIQVHHEKLWFAGKYKNWKLADFEINEIKEALDNIQAFCKDRPEIRSLPMINPAMDSLSFFIKQKNALGFNRSFTLLTNSCNSCHRATNHAFNVIKIPLTAPFTNQEFQPDSAR